MFVNANPEKYIGVTCTMNCGLEATIIAYRTYNDIDIQFEDGTIRLHTNVKSLDKLHTHKICPNAISVCQML